MWKSKKNLANDTEYQNALRALDNYSEKQQKKYGKGNVPEDATYHKLNKAVIEAEKKASKRAKATAYPIS